MLNIKNNHHQNSAKSNSLLQPLPEIIVDAFCGGGGASTGIELAVKNTGRYVNVAVNHDESAIVLHQANHPRTEHYLQSVFDVNPLKLVTDELGNPKYKIGILWCSPDCTHFSVASGKNIERSTEIRSLAWSIVRFACLPARMKPRIIYAENVKEFQSWGPLDADGRPIKEKKGDNFISFVKSLQALGYEVEWKELNASDYGAATSRKRLFLIARCDGNKIVWPPKTHGPSDSLEVQAGLKLPYKNAGSIIDWSLPVKPVLGRKVPIVSNTINRIEKGMEKFVLNAPQIYFVPNSHMKRAAYIITYFTETRENEVRGLSLYSPLTTITAKGNRFSIIYVDLVEIDSEAAHSIPYGTIRLDKFGNKVPDNMDKNSQLYKASKLYNVINPQMRMLEPRELFLAQGFPEDYIIDGKLKLHQLASRGIDERKLVKERIQEIKLQNQFKRAEQKSVHEREHFLQMDLFDFGSDILSRDEKKDDTVPLKVFHSYSKKQQISRVGNSVVPQIAEALVRANLPEYCINKMAGAI